jgi:hypothetical protein
MRIPLLASSTLAPLGCFAGIDTSLTDRDGDGAHTDRGGVFSPPLFSEVGDIP